MSWLGYAFRLHAVADRYLRSRDRIRHAAVDFPQRRRQDIPEFPPTLSRSLGMVFLLTIPPRSGWRCSGDRLSEPFTSAGVHQSTDTQQTAAGPGVLCGRAGGICGGQGAESGILRAGRLPHADDGEPLSDRDQLCRRDVLRHGPEPGPCGAGALDVQRGDFQLRSRCS